MKTKKQEKSNKKYWIAAGALCLASSVGVFYHPTHASQAEYTLAGTSVNLNGTDGGSVNVALKTSVARTYVSMQGTFSTHEVVGTGEDQTSYFVLKEMKRGGNTPITDFNANTGIGMWTPTDGNGMSVAANGEVLSGVYTIDKDTPAGTYTIRFSNGIFQYDVNGTDVDEADTIANTATITVTRNAPDDGGDDGDDGGDDGGDEDGNEDGDEDGDEDDSPAIVPSNTTTDGSSTTGLAVPDTGQMTEENNSANVAMISIATIISTIALGLAVVKTKAHKKVSFRKIHH